MFKKKKLGVYELKYQLLKQNLDTMGSSKVLAFCINLFNEQNLGLYWNESIMVFTENIQPFTGICSINTSIVEKLSYPEFGQLHASP